MGKRENGNVILVAPSTELAEQEARELEAQQAVESYAPLRTEYIRLSYAKAADVLTLISQGSGSAGSNNTGGSTTGNTNDSNNLLSNRGTVTVDERTNTLIVKDVAASIENIRKAVSGFKNHVTAQREVKNAWPLCNLSMVALSALK